MKSSELVGQRLRVVVKETPCACHYPGCDILTETVEGRVLRFDSMPCGPIGFIETDDGKTICFDAGCDIRDGIIELELITN